MTMPPATAPQNAPGRPESGGNNRKTRENQEIDRKSTRLNSSHL